MKITGEKTEAQKKKGKWQELSHHSIQQVLYTPFL